MAIAVGCAQPTPRGHGGADGQAGSSLAGGSGGSGGGLGRTDGDTGGTAGTGSVVLDAGIADGRSDPTQADASLGDRGTNAEGIVVQVSNHCTFDLWIHAAGAAGVLEPDNARLAPGDVRDYVAPDSWPAARVTAYGTGPGQGELDKVEMTLGNKVINYNITYVDWLGLPVEMTAIGSGADCKRVGCYIPQSQVAATCPDLLLQGQRCLSAGSYCAIAGNEAKPFCHALDANIAQCAQGGLKYPGCGNGTTPQVYGCAGFFAGSPKWCAALNRGMLDDPDNGDITLYYKNAPYNTYSAWVHTVCPGIYAFPYDDYGKTNESGFHACTGGSQLNITFCPAR